MAETSPPPTAGAESCSEEPAGGGEQPLEEPRRARAGDADREGDVGPPVASPGGQSEPDSPVAAPFFLLYPGDGGAGFAARPPPQQQRAWRTPPSPGSPLPFLLLSYPSGGGKHREWRRGTGGGGGQGPARARGAPPPSGSRSAAPAGGEWGRWGSPCPGTQGAATVQAPGYPPPSLPRPRAPVRPPLLSRARSTSSPASLVLSGSQTRSRAGGSLPWRSRGGGGAQRLGSPAVPPSAGSRRRGSQVGVAAAPPPGRPQLYL